MLNFIRSLINIEKKRIPTKKLQIENKKIKKIAVVIHIFYSDLVESIFLDLNNISLPADILVTYSHGCETQINKCKHILNNNLTLISKEVPNKGRDIAPWLLNFSELYLNYDLICKIHSKKSLHNGEMAGWKEHLYSSLIGSQEQVAHIIDTFDNNKNLGIAYPSYFKPLKPFIMWGRTNKKLAKPILNKLGIKTPHENNEFAAGSMFWYRPEAISPLFDLTWSLEDFPNEQGQLNSTIMHAIERIIVIIAKHEGYQFIQVEPKHLMH